MRIIIKALGIAAAAVAVIFSVAALLLWLVFDPENIRAELEAFVEDQTGREFSMDDELSLTLFPWLGIETGVMRLGHAAGFGDGDFASVESAVAQVRLLPLFRGRMEFGTVVLAGVNLNLVRDADGRDNWSDLLGPATAPSDEPGAIVPPDPVEAPFFVEIDVAGIDIRDGVVFWRENLDDARYVISDISLETGPITPGMPVDIDFGLQWVGVMPTFTARVDGQTTIVPDPENAGFLADSLRLEYRVEDGRSEERIAGNLETTATFDNASGTLRLDNVRLESDLTGFTRDSGPVEVSAIVPSVNLDTSAWTADIPEAVTTIGGITARWHGSAEDLAGEPLVAGTVAVDDSPVDEVLAMLGAESGPSMGNFDLESAFRLEPRAGRISLTGLEASLLDMAVTGVLALDETDLSGVLAVPSFDPGLLFSVLPREWLAGANVALIDQLAIGADFTVNRRDNGFSLHDFGATLNGAGISGQMDRSSEDDIYRGRIVAAGLDPDLLISVFPALVPDALDAQRLGELGLDTSFEFDAARSELRLEELSAGAFGLQANGHLTVLDPVGEPDITGSLQVANFSPRTLLTRFGQDVPPTADPAVLSRATLSADVSLGAGQAELDSLRMRLDDTNLTGRVGITDFADPRYTFDLDLDRIDLDRYMPPASEAPSAPDQEDQGFETMELADLNLAGRVGAGELRVSGLSLAGFSTRAELAEGIGRVEPLQATLYGGTFRGGVDLDIRAGGPFVSLRGSADGIDMEGLLTALSHEPARTSGTGTLDLQLTGNGDNLDEVISTATGSIRFALQDGALQGFNLDHAICDVYNQIGGYPQPSPAGVDATRYSMVRGTAQVRDGIAQTDDLLGTMSAIEVSGTGRVDLVSFGLDLELDAEMTASIPIPGCETLDGHVGRSIPLVVGGTAAEPSIRPDFEELLRDTLRERAEETVLDTLIDLLN